LFCFFQQDKHKTQEENKQDKHKTQEENKQNKHKTHEENKQSKHKKQEESLVFVLFVFDLRLVYPMLPVFLD
jgi:uncharacterized ion transporter superfamily protein YfcC